MRIYDFDRQVWSEGVPDLGKKRNSPAVFIAKDKMYIAGGYKDSNINASSFVNTTRIYDFAAGKWTDGPTDNLNRRIQSGVFYGDKFYIYGGSGFVNGIEQTLSDLRIFDFGAYGQYRPSLCQSAAINMKSLGSGQSATITLLSNETADMPTVKNFQFLFYNTDNQAGGHTDNPKPIWFTDNRQYAESSTVDTAVTAVNHTVRFADLYKPDLNWGDKYPLNIQINGYFVDPASGKLSAADKNCVVNLLLEPPETPKATVTAGISTVPTDCDNKTKGDADCNGVVDIADFGIWREEYISGCAARGPTANCDADFNNPPDGKITVTDYSIWYNNWPNAQ